MKNIRTLSFIIACLLFCSFASFGQDSISKNEVPVRKTKLKVDKSKLKVQRHTVMSRFEPTIARNEQERLQERKQRIASTKHKLSIIDTLDISDRKRRLLLYDLKHSPYSNRLNKALLVDTKFEDTSEN